MLVARRDAQHQRLEPRVEQERCDGVDQLHFEHLDGRHVGEQHPPRVPIAQIDLLQILIELAGGEEVSARDQLLGQQRHLRQRRGDELLPVLPILPVQPVRLQPRVGVSEQPSDVCRLLA